MFDRVRNWWSNLDYEPTNQRQSDDDRPLTQEERVAAAVDFGEDNPINGGAYNVPLTGAITMTKSRAMSIGVFKRGVDMIAGAGAAAKLTASDNGVYQLLTRPDPEKTYVEGMYDTFQGLVIDGGSYWRITDEALGIPTAVDIVGQQQCKYVLEPGNRQRIKEYKYKGKTIDREEVIYIPASSYPGEPCGRSKIEFLNRMLKTRLYHDQKMERMLVDWNMAPGHFEQVDRQAPYP